MKIVREIVDTEIKHLSVYEKRERILAQIRGKGVLFENVEEFLLKEARREGFYSHPDHVKKAREEKLAWIVYLDRYIAWIKRDFKKGWIRTERVVTPTSPQGKKEKVVKRKEAITPKRAKDILNNIKDRPVIEKVLEEEGTILVKESKLSPSILEKLLQDDDNLDLTLKILEEMGYQLIK